MINDLVSEEPATGARPLGSIAALRRGFQRTLVALRLKSPSFTDRVEAYRRGTADDRRARREAERCLPAVEQARSRLLRMARQLSEGGLRTTMQFSPITFRIAKGRNSRKFGFAELPAIIVISAGRPGADRTTALPITITSTLEELIVMPNFALLQTREQQGAMVELLLEAAHGGTTRDEDAFCERLENALARAVAGGRIRV
jgi:hypothetical protein